MNELSSKLHAGRLPLASLTTQSGISLFSTVLPPTIRNRVARNEGSHRLDEIALLGKVSQFGEVYDAD